jgi:C4-dicarboxylate-specific signal transduction histidine kinase
MRRMRPQHLRTLPRWAWPLGAAALALAGCAWLVAADLAMRREAFDTDARIAHRLLSQQAVQHDAMLATLTLLQPAAATQDAGSPSPSTASGGTNHAGPEQRLPALYPQVLQVLRRAGADTWPPAQAQAWAAAEAESARLQRAVLAQVDLAQGRYTLLRAGQPASYALAIDAAATVPWAEWPLPRAGPVRAVLRLRAQQWGIQPGAPAPGLWRFEAVKRLAADSQPFEVVVSRELHAQELPWLKLALWCVFSAAATAALAAWQRQREATRRAQELLRLGQVGRLNALGELAAGMAHELNQPLTAVLASTQAAQRLLADDEPDLATVRQALAQSAQQARRAADVVGRLRRLVQPPDTNAAPQALGLQAAVRQVLYLLAPQMDQLGVQVDASAVPEGLQVLADPVALEQIVHNLVLNALQALERGPAGTRRLALVAQAGLAQVRLHVQDSGPGFAPAALARAFEPFFTTRDGGLGLGLSLCETLAAGMGGALTARNRPEGGAELTLTLPQAGASPATP